jgi:RNA polymerase-binding transcription factor DksA
MGKKLSKTSIKKIKTYYIELKSRLEHSISNSDTEVDADGDEVDIIQAKNLIEINSKLLANNINLLKKVNIVLNNIDIININICDDCGGSIGERRLLANAGCCICFECACDRDVLAKKR